MKIAILGFGLEGRAAYGYWHEGNEITVCDKDESLDLPADVDQQLGEHYLKNLDRFDLIVRSPNIHPWTVIAANSPDILAKTTTNTNEFMRVSPSKNIIGVTGTKGKGTTSTLIARMLEAGGRGVHFGGNVGVPALELLKRGIHPEDWVILELSSFQLIDLRYGPHIGVCLMITAEHLDWHTKMDEYTESKSHLFAQQTADDIGIYYAQNEISRKIVEASPGRKLPYYAPPGAYVENDRIMIDGQEICQTSELKLLGRHNWQNVCAAVTAVWQISQDVQALRTVLTGFSGLEHRLELVREVDGVRYYDDSFGTTPETSMVALQAFNEPKVVILGGSDKGAAFNELAEVVSKSNIRKALLIGHQAPSIQGELEQLGFTNFIQGGVTMTEIVANARANAQPGDVVLLSPGCASFDMFANYKDRGDQFKAAVQALVSDGQ